MQNHCLLLKRAEARELAQCYVVGLMIDGERSSVEPMSKKVHALERGMQRLLTEVKWDCDGAFSEYRRQMLADTADPYGKGATVSVWPLFSLLLLSFVLPCAQ